MITITTPQGILELPVPQPDDATTIEGKCTHGINLFDTCHDCRWLESYPVHLEELR